MTAALATLLQHAERQRDEALAGLARAEDFAARMAAQTQQLNAYRDDYRRRHPAQGGRSASIELLRCHQGFMQRLDQAIAQQRAQQHQAEQGALEQRAAVRELQIRAAAVAKLIERRGAEHHRHESRLEQRRNDEAARRHGGGRDCWQASNHAAPSWQHSTQTAAL